MKHDPLLLTFACLVIAGALSSCSSTDSVTYAGTTSDSSWGGSAVGTATAGFAGDRYYGNMNSLYYGNRYGYYGYASPYQSRVGYGYGRAYRSAAYGSAYRARARSYGRAAVRARVR